MGNNEINARWPGSCFGCSPNNPIGLKLRFRHAERGCETRCSIPDSLCGFDGLVHGGILSTILDETAAWALFAHLGRFAVTRELTTSFIKPVATNTEVIVEGRVVSHDKVKAQVHCSIRSPEGVLLAEAESDWVFVKTSRIASLAGVDEEVLCDFLKQCVANKLSNDDRCAGK
ncbi:MAG TPA: PaaI family thioesterase [Geobacteraceae bacterium]|nr:PaaI family thioesterase [Geobacteraceae bacterium]